MLMAAPLVMRIALQWGALGLAMSAVASLHDIFFSAKTQKLCIVSDASTGTAKTVTRLMSEVARCSDYIESAGLTVSASADGDSDC